ncbi:MAG: hypothetical protein GXP14_07400 [Gammaproteobacteria bacterium]|nr:hypothetical protein [Gammaproteobacteria bacterium]
MSKHSRGVKVLVKNSEATPIETITTLDLAMSFYLTSEDLPEDGEYVLIHLLKNNWGDSDDPLGKRYWKVAKFREGISEEDRLKMKNGELIDPDTVEWTCPTPPGKWVSSESKRSTIYKCGDVHGNNLVPYVWDEIGPGAYFGQEVDIWARLPDLDKIIGA